jgi:hypothetical protein
MDAPARPARARSPARARQDASMVLDCDSSRRFGGASGEAVFVRFFLQTSFDWLLARLRRAAARRAATWPAPGDGVDRDAGCTRAGAAHGAAGQPEVPTRWWQPRAAQARRPRPLRAVPHHAVGPQALGTTQSTPTQTLVLRGLARTRAPDGAARTMSSCSFGDARSGEAKQRRPRPAGRRPCRPVGVGALQRRAQ